MNITKLKLLCSNIRMFNPIQIHVVIICLLELEALHLNDTLSSLPSKICTSDGWCLKLKALKQYQKIITPAISNISTTSYGVHMTNCIARHT